MSTLRIPTAAFGTVTVVERNNSRKLSARWINGELHVNIPAARLSPRRISEMIERHRHDFESIRPQARYSPGMAIRLDGGVDICIDVASGSANSAVDIRRASSTTAHSFIIGISPTLPSGSPEIQRAVDTAVKTIARHLAPQILLPRARDIAARLGLDVKRWEISHGKTILGMCFPKERRIRLSYMCLFLSSALRDYIICHELAHLTEAGHTPAFHSLCNLYCGGNESRLRAQLHRFRWPVDR